MNLSDVDKSDQSERREHAPDRLRAAPELVTSRPMADHRLLHTAVVPAVFMSSLVLAWIQHRFVVGAPSAPLSVFALPGLFGLAMGVALASLLVARRSAVARATVDELTGIKNRAALRAALHTETERSSRYGTPFGVIVFDVDHFKTVNDTHGHQAGDLVLMHLSEVVGRIIRSTDVFGRWGGDEFVLIAPGTGASGCRVLAEKLREEVARSRAPGELAVTVSVGCAGFVTGDSAGTILGRADEALYEAKRAGRNRSAATRCLRSTGSHSRIVGDEAP